MRDNLVNSGLKELSSAGRDHLLGALPTIYYAHQNRRVYLQLNIQYLLIYQFNQAHFL